MAHQLSADFGVEAASLLPHIRQPNMKMSLGGAYIRKTGFVGRRALSTNMGRGGMWGRFGIRSRALQRGWDFFGVLL